VVIAAYKMVQEKFNFTEILPINGKKGWDHFFSSIFTLRASWRLPSAVLLRVCNPAVAGWLHP
jgi:hypothetical protein